MTTKEDIKEWLNRPHEGMSHMLVVCDTFDHGDYPVFISKEKKIEDAIADYSKNMQRVIEIYSFSPKYTQDEQLNERRARHLD